METPWPMPKFHFQVTWAGLELSCREVSGLNPETQTIEYRHGNSPQFSTIKMPGLLKGGNVTLKKVVTSDASMLFQRFNRIEMNAVERATATIVLLDERGSPSMSWTLANAWPTKVAGTDLAADGDEAAIETIEFAHEGLTVLGR